MTATGRGRLAALIVASVLASIPGCGGARPPSAPSVPCGQLGGGPGLDGRFAEAACLALHGRSNAATRASADRAVRSLYADLLLQPLDDAAVARWGELYRIQADLYPRVDVVAGTRVHQVNGHHFAVPAWVRESMSGDVGALLHFDTHPDMDAIPRVEDVRSAIAALQAGRDVRRSWHVLAHAAHEIGQPVTAGVAMAGYRDVVWVRPSWAAWAPEFHGLEFMLGRRPGTRDGTPLPASFDAADEPMRALFAGQRSDLWLLAYAPSANGGVHVPTTNGDDVPYDLLATGGSAAALEHPIPFRLSIVAGDKADAHRSEAIAHAIPGGGFTLDLDLDYFVNEGGAWPRDRPSWGRVESTVDFDANDHVASRFRRIGLEAERAEIERRLDRFAALLRDLAAHGKRPALVTIADSSHLPFAGRREGVERDTYTPSEHVLYVQTRVRAILADVLSAPSRPGLPPPPASPAAHGMAADGPATPGDARDARVEDALGDALVWAIRAFDAKAASVRDASAVLRLLGTLAWHAPEPLAPLARAAGRACVAILEAPLGPKTTEDPGALVHRARLVAYAASLGDPRARAAARLAYAHAAQWLPGLSIDPVEETRPVSTTSNVDTVLAEVRAEGSFGDADRAARSISVLLAAWSRHRGQPARASAEGAPVWPWFPLTHSDIRAALHATVVGLVARCQTTTCRGALQVVAQASDRPAALLARRALAQSVASSEANEARVKDPGEGARYPAERFGPAPVRLASTLEDALRDAPDDAVRALADPILETRSVRLVARLVSRLARAHEGIGSPLIASGVARLVGAVDPLARPARPDDLADVARAFVDVLRL